ncbi:AAA family ATPase [Saccharibacillus sp. JS10]|uniref:AAA family ATPase n=1 Tax=Saccharibacillus sp. JS10 TaxID=2950552 RepID=UPI00210BF9C0|nr:AAA family ATPase [Saccharibacillus sp. JS10]MCQ4088470.1 AAA family ATPase [Saccharibacillus sp. JS10]
MSDQQEPFRRIHIFGASGSGATTLGKALEQKLNEIYPNTHYELLDSDDYFWERKFDVARSPEERIAKLQPDLAQHERWILSGSVCKWGDVLKSSFDLVIFLYVPETERLKRLQEREYDRYGKKVLPGGSMYEESQAFLEWASLYDHSGEEVRSLELHERWLEDLNCPIWKIEGSQTVEERIQFIIEKMEK